MALDPSSAVWGSGESLLRRLGRRLVTIPCAVILGMLAVVALPVGCLVGGLLDLWPGGKRTTARAVFTVSAFLIAEMVSLGVAGWVWLRHALIGTVRSDAFIRANQRIQINWGRSLLGMTRWTYNMGLRIRGSERLLEPGPILLLVRHVSLVDTIIPFVLFPAHSRAFRFVLKVELLLDPLLDVVGQRFHNCWVRRGAGRTEQEAAKVVALARGMSDREALVLFPEGTRFRAAKRQRLIARFEEKGDAAAADYARSLMGSLPPTRRGTLAVLEGLPDLDVVVVAHRGLEGARSLPAMASGALLGKTLDIEVRRFGPHERPTDPTELRAWIETIWRDVDAFVTAGPDA